MALLKISHPIALHKLSILRDKNTDMMTFRRTMRELSVILAVEVTKALELQPFTPITPLGVKAEGFRLASKVLLLPIIRAGLGMLDGFLEVIPEAKVGFIGIYRDETTLEAKSYYYHIPKLSNSHVFILDPMLATGGSIRKALSLVEEKLDMNKVNSVKVISVIAYEKTLQKLLDEYRNVDFCVVGIDSVLNEKAYIVPGLGDAGDRTYGSKEELKGEMLRG